MAARKVISKADRDALLNGFGGVCFACKCPLGGVRWEAHHLKPVSCGGDNSWGNMAPLCLRCHDLVSHPVDMPAFFLSAGAWPPELVILGLKVAGLYFVTLDTLDTSDSKDTR